MTDYFITISSQQKGNQVRLQELEDVQFWLSANGVKFICRRYESTGKYKQLHFHGIARFKGRFQGLVAWGAAGITDNTYSIRWVKVTNYYNLLTYLLKPGSYEAYSPFKDHHMVISPPRDESGGAPTPPAQRAGNWGVNNRRRPQLSLATILKRTL